jgi:ligand-binding SRPBCC domain-containing protein
MPRLFILRDETEVHASIERCFLLSTSIELVQRELRMAPVRGRTSGLVAAGDTILWKGRQFGLPQFHESLIEAFNPPVFFSDRMIAGRFATCAHDHHFTDSGNQTTVMADELRFSMPFGWLGAWIGEHIVAPHIRRLMRRRFALLKRIAEGEEWRLYLSQGDV